MVYELGRNDIEETGIGVRVSHDLKIMLSRRIQCRRGAKCLYRLSVYADGSGVVQIYLCIWKSVAQVLSNVLQAVGANDSALFRVTENFA